MSSHLKLVKDWKAKSKLSDKKKSPLRLIRKNSGQVVIEYVLLMVILASLGAVIMRSFVSRNADEPGILVAKWNNLLKTIAEDNPEE